MHFRFKRQIRAVLLCSSVVLCMAACSDQIPSNSAPSDNTRTEVAFVPELSTTQMLLSGDPVATATARTTTNAPAQRQNGLQSILLSHSWYSDIQSYYAYRFLDGGKIETYSLQSQVDADTERFELVQAPMFVSYRFEGELLCLRERDGSEIKLCCQKDSDGRDYFKETDVDPALYEEGAGYSDTWLRIRDDPIRLVSAQPSIGAAVKKISEDEAVRIGEEYFSTKYEIRFGEPTSWEMDGSVFAGTYGIQVSEKESEQKYTVYLMWKPEESGHWTTYGTLDIGYDGTILKEY